MPRGSPSEVTQPAETALPRRGKVKAKRKARRDEPTGAHEYNSKGTEMPGEADIGASEVEAVPETTGKKKLSTEALSDFNEKERRRYEPTCYCGRESFLTRELIGFLLVQRYYLHESSSAFHETHESETSHGAVWKGWQVIPSTRRYNGGQEAKKIWG